MQPDWPLEKKRLAEEVLSILISRQVVKSGSFSLHLGKEADYYLDLRLIPSYPSDFGKICDAYCKLITTEVGKIDRLTGAAYSAIPFAIIASIRLGVPYLYVEKIEESGSLKSPVYGHMEKNDRVVILDDVVASGITLLLTASVIRAAGGMVEDAIVLVDREQGAERLLRDHGVRLHYFLKLPDILSKLPKHGA